MAEKKKNNGLVEKIKETYKAIREIHQEIKKPKTHGLKYRLELTSKRKYMDGTPFSEQFEVREPVPNEKNSLRVRYDLISQDEKKKITQYCEFRIKNIEYYIDGAGVSSLEPSQQIKNSEVIIKAEEIIEGEYKNLFFYKFILEY